MRVKWLILTAFFTAMYIVGAFIKIPMFPVAITLQSVFVVLSGIILGYKRAFLSVVSYMVLGLLGLPVFSGGGGVMYVLNPMFGYIIGFVLCAVLVGLMREKCKRLTLIKLFIIAFWGHILIYIVGMTYYMFLIKVYFGTHKDVFSVLYSFVLVFIPGDLVKCIISSFLGKKLIKIIERV